MKNIESLRLIEIKKLPHIVGENFNGKLHFNIKTDKSVKGIKGSFGDVVSADVLSYKGKIITGSLVDLNTERRVKGDNVLSDINKMMSTINDISGNIDIYEYNIHELKEHFEKNKENMMRSNVLLSDFVARIVGETENAIVRSEEIYEGNEEKSKKKEELSEDGAIQEIKTKLGNDAARIYTMIDGNRSIGDIVESTGIPKSEVIKILKKINAILGV